MANKKKSLWILVCIAIVIILGSVYYFSGYKIKQKITADNQIQGEKNDTQNKEYSNNNETLKKDDVIVIRAEDVPVNKNKIQEIHAKLEDDIYWIQSAIDDNGIILGNTQFDTNNVQKLLLYDIKNKKPEFIYSTEPKWSIGQAEMIYTLIKAGYCGYTRKE